MWAEGDSLHRGKKPEVTAPLRLSLKCDLNQPLSSLCASNLFLVQGGERASTATLFPLQTLKCPSVLWMDPAKAEYRSRGVRVCVRAHACALSHYSRVWLWDPMDCSPPGSSVHGILQARILEWVAISSSRASSPSRDPIFLSYVSCIGKWVLYY